MNRITVAAALVAAGFSMPVFAQHAGHDTGKPAATGASTAKSASAVGVVKKVDAGAQRVTLAHEPVKSLNWPAMTMAFKVRDKALLDKMVPGRKIDFDFVEEGGDYVVTAVR